MPDCDELRGDGYGDLFRRESPYIEADRHAQGLGFFAPGAFADDRFDEHAAFSPGTDDADVAVVSLNEGSGALEVAQVPGAYHDDVTGLALREALDRFDEIRFPAIDS